MGLVRLVRALKVKEVLLSRFALKSTVAGGAVYYTVREGLWSKPDESIKFYERLYNRIAPYVKDNVPKDIISEIPEIPSPRAISNTMGACWNKGVIASTKFISETPTHLSNGMSSLSSTIQKQLDQKS